MKEGENLASQKVLEHYLRELRKIEEHREKWCEQNVRRYYKELVTDLQSFLGTEYATLAEDDKLTYEILHKKGQYARFVEEVINKVDKVAVKSGQETLALVQTTYQKCYEGMVDAVINAKNYDDLKVNLKGVRAITPEQVKNIVNNKVMEQALEKNHKSSIREIKQQLAIGLSQGDRMTTMAKRLSDQCNKDYRKSVQIIRTEAHRVREAGYQEASERMSNLVEEADSGYVMTKTWKTMQDGAVRPQRIKGKVIVIGKGPDHMKMNNVTILVNEEFDLGDGTKTKAPGQSGVAGHDINCRCYLSRDLMTIEEFEKLTGRKLNKTNPAKKLEKQEQELVDKQNDLLKQKDKLEKRKVNLESYEYEGIWKDKVTVKDYESKLSSIQSKKDFYNDKLKAFDLNNPEYKSLINTYDDVTDIVDVNLYLKENIGLSDRMAFGLDISQLKHYESLGKDEFVKYVTGKIDDYRHHIQSYIDNLDNFVAQGKAYLKINSQVADIDDKLVDLTKQISSIKYEKAKYYGIDFDEMQKEIDDLAEKLNKAKQKAKKADLQDQLTKKQIKFIKTKEEFGIEIDIDEAKILYKAKQAEMDEMVKELTTLKNSAVNGLNDIKIEWLDKTFSANQYKNNAQIKAQIDNQYKVLTQFKDYGLATKSDLDDLAKYEEFFKKIADFDASGPIDNLADIAKLEKAIDGIQNDLDSLINHYKFSLASDSFSREAYTQKRKDAAYWFTSSNGGAKAADGVLRDKCGEVWRNATKSQKESAYRYTYKFKPYNEPLRGQDYGTGKFIGIENVDFDSIGMSYAGYKKGEVKGWINDLTDIIDNSTYDFDMWVQRGTGLGGMDKFFGINSSDFYLSEAELAAKLLGTTPTEYAFMSCGVAKSKGLNLSGQGITFNIYAPKGTKMMYLEPFSHYGNGAASVNWDGITKQSSVGGEAEILLQRGTKFRVIKVKKTGSRWYIDMEIIEQNRGSL